ncbi:glycosyltransferase [Emticicia sp. 21SJ11W-3]|uniref:glycosyltransferase n=1 Tax=Emticicia sp. 21SJ11W-3 TaxID=2916755 RepID=UPI0020A1B219|nr:glycosyltransferase [Emticicia sp. 21SJ11W-3]UTA68758.1 hypothetical protein MB380_02890 [Emticicia sp. 21SJ11W-3]
MPERKAVFIMPMLFGHLNPTITMANALGKHGYKVFYAGSKQLVRFTLKNNFKLYLLETIAVNRYSLAPENKSRLSKWLVTMRNNYLEDAYHRRKADLKKLIEELNPDVVFLDEFCSLDFIALYSLKPSLRVFILHGKMGMYYNKKSPPGNYYAFPDSMGNYLWKWVLFYLSMKRYYKKCLYMGKNFESRLEKIMRAEQIPSMYTINYKKLFTTSFTNIPEILFYATEFDFPDVSPLPWQTHLSPGVASERREFVTEEVLQFLTLAKASEQNRIVYCSLGTVTDIHLTENSARASFIDKIMQIATANAHLFFIISFGEDLQKQKYSNIGVKNLLALNFAPQLHILKYADIFITHGGSNSIFESIYSKTPMIVFPLNNEWDQNGNAARVVFYRLGLKSDLEASAERIALQINYLLVHNSFKNTVSAFANRLKEKYTDDYIINKLNEIGI